jgi:hypothetical protein
MIYVSVRRTADHKVTKYGHYNPWIFLGATLTAISGGVFATFKTTTGNNMINGILVMSGFGASIIIQMVCFLCPLILGPF